MLTWLREYNNLNRDRLTLTNCLSYADTAADAVKASLTRQWLECKNKDQGLRVSKLGYPAMPLLLEKFLEIEDDEPITSRSLLTFSIGDYIEAYFEFVTSLMPSFEIVSKQQKVTWKGVPGHYDFIVLDKHTGRKYLVDVKSSNDRYYTLLDRLDKVDDSRGYLTQLAVYSECVDVDGVWLVVFNKNTSEVNAVMAEPEDMENALIRASRVVELYNSAETVDDVYRTVQPVPPEPEVFRKQKTGLYKVPQSMAYSPWRYVIYDIVEQNNGYNKPTEYVVDFLYPPHLQEYKPCFPS